MFLLLVIIILEKDDELKYRFKSFFQSNTHKLIIHFYTMNRKWDNYRIFIHFYP